MTYIQIAEVPVPQSTPFRISLSQQYGGHHSGEWVNYFPQSWIPYIQLCRLSPPVALLLIYLPHLFGVLHGASTHGDTTGGNSVGDVIRISCLLFGGSFFCNNASHAWNDLVDASIDTRVARTLTRPIPRGSITPIAAFVFTVTQALCAATFLAFLPSETSFIIIPNILTTTYYPYAKRHIDFPQLILGFCLSWGVIVGSSAIGDTQSWEDPSTLCLLTALIFWVMIFDTIYAHQDLIDDIKLGVKSTAVVLRGHVKPFLWLLLICMSASFLTSGYLKQAGLLYHIFSVGGTTLPVGMMLLKVKLHDPANCWIWFSRGFLTTAISVGLGLLTEFQFTSCIS
jgi:4-hydroxybenzoate polyprenyltransferase